MSNLTDLKESILADGVIDEAEVKLLHDVLYVDGIIDKEEAEFLFDLNDAVSGKENHPSWKALFINAISSFLLDDINSPGEVDDEEANWLLSKILGDGKLDDVEIELINYLASRTDRLPKSITNLIK